jgi:hypothetical protein
VEYEAGPARVDQPRTPSEGRPFAIASIIIGAIAFPTQMLLGACCAWIVWPLVGAGIILGIIAIAMRDVPWGAAGVALNVLATIIQILALSGLIAGLGAAGSHYAR